MHDKLHEEPTAYVVFCDDARLEASGKVTIVGMYSGFMALPAPTAQLSKLVAFVQISFPRSFEGKPLTMTIWQDSEKLAEATLPVPGVPRYAPTAASHRIPLSMPAEIVPFAAVAGTTLKVELSCGDSWKLESAPLLIVQHEQAAGLRGEG